MVVEVGSRIAVKVEVGCEPAIRWDRASVSSCSSSNPDLIVVRFDNRPGLVTISNSPSSVRAVVLRVGDRIKVHFKRTGKECDAYYRGPDRIGRFGAGMAATSYNPTTEFLAPLSYDKLSLQLPLQNPIQVGDPIRVYGDDGSWRPGIYKDDCKNRTEVAVIVDGSPRFVRPEHVIRQVDDTPGVTPDTLRIPDVVECYHDDDGPSTTTGNL